MFSKEIRDFFSHKDGKSIWEKVTGYRPGKTPQFADQIGQLKYKVLNPNQLKIWNFLNHRLPGTIAKKLAIPVVGGLVICSHYLGLPVVHNYLLRSSYENRATRHKEYLKEKPEYKEALLEGYDLLRPTRRW